MPPVYERVLQSSIVFVAAPIRIRIRIRINIAVVVVVAVVRFIRHSCWSVGVFVFVRVGGATRTFSFRTRLVFCCYWLFSAPPASISGIGTTSRTTSRTTSSIGTVQQGGGLPIPAKVVNGNGNFLSYLGFLLLGVALHVHPRR